MWGHKTALTRYDYLTNIGALEKEPNGTAKNGICIYPPSQVYKSVPEGPLTKGDVFVDKLKFGTQNSDSVKRLQFVLNNIKLKDGKTLKVTGDYDLDTKNEATKWQIQVDKCTPGTAAADGNIGPKQAKKLFPPPYVIK